AYIARGRPRWRRAIANGHRPRLRFGILAAEGGLDCAAHADYVVGEPRNHVLTGLQEPAAETAPFRPVIVCGVMRGQHPKTQKAGEWCEKSRAHRMQMDQVRMQKQPRIEYGERRVYERFESLATRRPETDHAHIGEAARLGIAAPSDNDDFEALIEARQRRIQMFAVRFDAAHDIGYATQANGADFQGQPRSRTGTLS